MNLKPETLQRIDEVITHYPTKRSATLPLLHLIQEDIGYIPHEAHEWIATKLEIQPINVYDVVNSRYIVLSPAALQTLTEALNE